MTGALAQLVEQRTENPCVPGSIPGGTTIKTRTKLFGFFSFNNKSKCSHTFLFLIQILAKFYHLRGIKVYFSFKKSGYISKTMHLPMNTSLNMIYKYLLF